MGYELGAKIRIKDKKVFTDLTSYSMNRNRNVITNDT
jgi:hypothetical protein